MTEYPDGSLDVSLGWFSPDGMVTASYERGAGQLKTWTRQANGVFGVGPILRFPPPGQGRESRCAPRAWPCSGATSAGSPPAGRDCPGPGPASPTRSSGRYEDRLLPGDTLPRCRGGPALGKRHPR